MKKIFGKLLCWLGLHKEYNENTGDRIRLNPVVCLRCRKRKHIVAADATQMLAHIFQSAFQAQRR